MSFTSTSITTEQMESMVFNILKKQGINFYCPKQNNMHDIYQLFQYENINSAIQNAEYYHYLGMFYHAKKDYENAEKYYLLALRGDPNNDFMMNDLGTFYHTMKKDDDKAILYWTLASEKGNSYAELELGKYFYKKSNIPKAIAYYVSAIERGNKSAMYALGVHFYHMKDYEKMEKYWLMASERIHTSATFDLANYYLKIEKNLEKSNQYWLLGKQYCNKNIPFKSELF